MVKKLLILIILIIGLSSCCTLSDTVYVPEYYPNYYSQRVIVVHPVHKHPNIHKHKYHPAIRHNNTRHRRKR